MLREENLKVCFKALDLNADGKVSIDELKKALDENENFKGDSPFWDKMFKGIDFKKKDYISFEEFSDLMRKEKSPKKKK